jgi:Fungal Zn(2)-Cys(6) binuclear cluster domain
MANSNPTQQSLKRKQSVAGITTAGRNVKRRASKACHCCRSRKVRCDVVEGGIPCTNCRLDEVECLVTEGKRRRKSYVDGEIIHHHSPPTSVEGDKELQSLPIFDDINALHDLSFSLNELEPDANLATLEEDLHLHRPHMICKWLPNIF